MPTAPLSHSPVDLGLAYACMGEAVDRIITQALTTALKPLVDQAPIQNRLMDDVRKDRQLLMDLLSTMLDTLKELKPLVRNNHMAQSGTKSTGTHSVKTTGASLTLKANSSGPSAAKSRYAIPSLSGKSTSSADHSSSRRRSPSPRRPQTGSSKKRFSHHHSASHSHSREKRSRHH